MTSTPTDGALEIAGRGFVAIFPISLVATVISILVTYLQHDLKVLPLILVTFINAGITAFVAFAAHNYVLSGEVLRGFGAMRSNNSRAFVIFLFLSFLVVALMHLLSYMVTQMNVTALGDASRLPTSEQILRGVAISFSLAILIVLIMCAFGTVFPAIVHGGDTSLHAAWQRKTTWKIFTRLIGVLIVAFILLLSASFIIFPLMKTGGPELLNGSLPWQVIVSGTIATFLNFFLTILVAVIFSKAYLGSYTKPPA